jgi:hypothetical protein
MEYSTRLRYSRAIDKPKQGTRRTTMNTLKNVVIGLVSIMIFGLAVRTGFRAEQAAIVRG